MQKNTLFFSGSHGIFSMIDHILGHKSSLSKLKKSEIISSIFFDQDAMKLDVKYRGGNCKKHIEIKQYIYT